MKGASKYSAIHVSRGVLFYTLFAFDFLYSPATIDADNLPIWGSTKHTNIGGSKWIARYDVPIH
jgi:hypothetical protein